MAKQTHIPVIKFNRHKYGGELLVDVVTLDTIRNGPNFAKALRQSFYGLMLTTGGEGEGAFAGKPTSYYDLFRLADGKIAEHWDVMETIAPESEWKHRNGKYNFPE